MHTGLIILFTRFPVAGKVKTRLIPSLGAEGAKMLHAQMAEHAFAMALATGYDVQVHYAESSEKDMRHWLDPQGIHARVNYVAQIPHEDLGQRMAFAFDAAFANGYKKVLLMGSDCPRNSTENIQNAFQWLDDVPCVFGPAVDGGYYLVGLHKMRQDIFMDIAWSTDKVLAQTLAKVDSYALVDTLSDVDMPQDIPQKISVIIPALNEEKTIAKTIAAAQKSFLAEIIVVDGGSEDATCAVATQAGSTVYTLKDESEEIKASRATQMNVGAKKARGDILLFLHADTLLPSGWDFAVRHCLQDKNVSLGCFAFALDGDFTGKKLVEWGTNMRTKYAHLPYGDQGIFMRSEDFANIGTYKNIPILEDVYLVKAAKKLGRIQSLSLPLVTSARRWIKHGALRVTYYNQLVFIAISLGADVHAVRRAYRSGKNPLLCLFTKN